ncbi:MAG TPA: hypothetical protein VJN18_10035 [Polyangiaceae bacterium]|nr:hypothetical protein [Polyangiaceae bacterium]
MRIGWLLLGCALAACSESPAPPGGGDPAGASSSASGGSPTAGTNAAAGNGDGAGTASGDAGTGGSVSVGGGAGGASGAGGAAGACGPSAIACDDFEKYPPGATDLGPDWLVRPAVNKRKKPTFMGIFLSPYGAGEGI